MQKILSVIIITALIVGIGSFYGGMKYAESKNPQSNFAQADFQNFRNLSPEERQDMLQKSGADLSARGGNRTGAGMATGEIIAKDEQSVTVKLSDGGSKIIFFSDSTGINKFESGAISDLAVGKIVSVNGATNEDGSITAQLIQIRTEAQKE